MTFITLVHTLIQENTLGLIEDIYIDKIGSLKAKTDTGNEAHNVIHGTNVQVENDQVTFNCGANRITLPLQDTIKIHIGDGNVQDRPVVLCNCTLNGKKYFNIPFSVSDRTENTYKVLLGAPFIKAAGGLVDITKKD